MNEVNWQKIFNIEDFKYYLNTSEFKELSKLSKITYFNLKPNVFQNIKITYPAIEKYLKGYIKSNNITTSKKKSSELPLDEYIPLLNRCFKPLLTHTRVLNANFGIDHYQLLEFSNLLPRLTILNISDTKLSLTSFKQVMGNLQKLEILSVETVIFIYYAGESNQASSMSFPNSLKHIYWNYCKLFSCNLEDPRKLNFKYSDVLTDQGFFKIPPVNLPNLKKFNTMVGRFPLNTELLLANPQITSINFDIGEFKETLFCIFDLIKNIKEFGLNVTLLEIGLNMDLVRKFSLPNLTHFYFNDAGFQNWPLIEKIIVSSPNITNIRIMAENKPIHFIMDWFKKLTKLEKLLIVAEDERKVNLDRVSLSPSLKHLELGINVNTKKILKNYQHNTHLKVISVYNMYFTPKLIRELKQE